MSLTVADIERWDAGDVREVFHAAHTRAQAARDAANGLATLPVLGTWTGVAADAARQALERTRVDLDSHGQEALVVADAARKAADGIDALHADLARLRADAAAHGLEIDPYANRIVPVPGSRHGRREMQQAIPPLQARLNSLVELASMIDTDLATAIHLADGTTPMPPSLHANDPEVQQVLSGPLPEDPVALNALWDRLSREDRDLLYARDPQVGNRPGIPAGSGQDFYNRRHLDEALAAARATNDPHLPALQALDETIRDQPDYKLMLLDTSGEDVLAAVSVGDPDTATHVAVTTPGLNTTVAKDVKNMVAEARSLRQQALNQLSQEPGHAGETVATIAWIGYDTPQIPGFDDVAASLQGINDVSHDVVARGAAVDLSRFYEGIQAAHQRGPTHLTAIGHSYGSLTTGLALQQPGEAVRDAVVYGSPGIEATTPAQLGLAPGHVYTMETPDDPIQLVYDAPPIARVLAPMIPGELDDILLGAADASGAGQFGPNPATNPNFVHLETGAVAPGDGHSRDISLAAASGHSDYPREVPIGSAAPVRTTVYNLAAVVAGLTDNVILQK